MPDASINHGASCFASDIATDRAIAPGVLQEVIDGKPKKDIIIVLGNCDCEDWE